jgi:hypothetical protein
VEIQKAIIEFLIATLPAVFLYFIGWGYLYFYFSAFGINISEIHLDTSTVFIHAFSPIQIVLNDWRIWVGPAIFGVAAAVAVVGITSKLLPPDIKMRVQATGVWLTDGSALGIKLVMLISVLVIISMILKPVLKWAALQQQIKIWAGQAEVIVPLVDSPGEKAKPWTLTDPSLRQRESYVQCRNEQALLLIFSDDKAYYALCKSRENSDAGIVFEVRREGGLASARFASPGE